MAKKTAARSVRPAPVARRAPAREESTERAPRAPFLKAADIGRRATLKLIPGTVRTIDTSFGHQLIVDVKVGGEVFSWGIGTNKPNLRMLVEYLISNPGKPIEVVSMQGQSGSFIAIPKNEDRMVHEDDDDIPF